MKRHRLPVEHLEPGMYVVELDRPWLESPFLFQGFPIVTTADLVRVRRCCRYVYIDLDQSRDWHRTRAPDAAHRFATERLNLPVSGEGQCHDRGAYRHELAHASDIYRRGRSIIQDILESAAAGQVLALERGAALVAEMLGSLEHEENALVWFTRLKSPRSYTPQHSLDTAILTLLLGIRLGLPRDEIEQLGLGALLHDIGKMRVPPGIIEKPAPLTDSEMTAMREHPNHGYKLLRGEPRLSRSVLDVVYAHHERLDGSGYPRGLTGTHISRQALVVGLVDAFDAITADQVYHQGISPHEALRRLETEASERFPADLLKSFLECLGIFPVGSIVELSTGEVGVVVTVNRVHHLRPLITVLLDRDKQPYPSPELRDLEELNQAGRPVSVKRILESRAYDIDIRDTVNPANLLSAGSFE